LIKSGSRQAFQTREFVEALGLRKDFFGYLCERHCENGESILVEAFSEVPISRKIRIFQQRFGFGPRWSSVVMKIRLIYNSVSSFKFVKTTVVVVFLIEIEMVLLEVLGAFKSSLLDP